MIDPTGMLTLSSMDHVCKYSTDTFNSKWPDGSKSYGGYADYWRGKYSFVIKIPEAIPSDEAAPMLCGGITGESCQCKSLFCRADES